MRNVYVSNSCTLGPGTAAPPCQEYRGYEAYTFLLEVVLGLHSNLLGETEVFHQFRKAFHEAKEAPLVLVPYLKKLYMDIAADSRVIRSKHMHGLGELSYGGVARRFLKNRASTKVTLLGTGQLAQKLLPWLLKDSHSVCIVGRNAERLEDLGSIYKVQTYTYEKLNSSHFEPKSVLITAAPLDLGPYKKFFQREMCLLDFRAEADENVPEGIEYHSLNQMLAQIKRSRIKRKQMLWHIRPILNKVLSRRKQTAYQSVHGWEDMAHSYVI